MSLLRYFGIYHSASTTTVTRRRGPLNSGQPLTSHQLKAATLAAAALALALASALTLRNSAVLVKPGFSAAGVALFTVFYGFSGAYSWLRRPGNGFGLMIAGAGFICGAGALLVADAWTFTVGRVVMATLVVFMAYVMLCCPSGHLRAPAERVVLGIFIAVTVAVWVAALLASTRLPAAGPLYDCFGRCPGNAARVANVSGGSGRVVNYIVDGANVAGLIAVCAVLIGRLLSPSKVQRRTLGPMIACVVVWSAAVSAYVLLHEAGATGGTEALRALAAASVLGIPVAMVVGQWRGRLFVAYGLVDFATELGAAPLSPAVVEKLMRKAVGDPALQLLLWREHDSYVDVHGAAATPPQARGVRILTIPAAGGGPYAAVSFDVHLTDSDALVEGLAKMSLLVLDNERLAVELADSRARIAREGAAERLRLERDLHDGAQQRLLLLKLALADLREGAEDGLGPKLDAAMAEADEAIDEIRRLGHGIYPPALIDLGLGAALRSVAGAAPVAVRLDDGDIGRSTPAVEYAVYLVVHEALQNAFKHAGPGAGIRVTLSANGDELAFSVADDGCGFQLDPSALASTGIVNMTDRIGSVGGHVWITTSPGAGTTVQGVVPGAFAVSAR